jgi:hypothetical protein
MGPHSSAVLDHWEVWSTPTYPQGASWSAKPIGALTAVCQAPDPASLQIRIRDYTRNLDAHVREARQKLDALPENYHGEREVQERLIDALASLSVALRA